MAIESGRRRKSEISLEKTSPWYSLSKAAPLAVLTLLVCSGFFIVPARAQTTTCTENQPCYFGYDTAGTYIPYPTPFPGYWQTTYKGQKVKVTTAVITISLEGFPSQYSTDLTVDGKAVGSVAGGGTAKFQIKGDEVHSFQVSSYVTGTSGERYYSKGNSWTSEKGKEVEVTSYEETYIPYYYWWTGPNYYWYYYYPYYVPSTKTVIQPFDQSYTFRYEAECELTVQNAFGGGVSQAGWYPKDSSVTLSTKPLIESSEDTRNVFVAWTLNGVDENSEQVTIKMNQPYSASAKYKKQYYVDVRSDYGNPSGSGWYDEGSKATVQVDKELSLEGFWGALGGKRVFDHWSGAGTGSSTNIAEISVDAPKLIVANWSADMTGPYVIMVLLVLAIVVVILTFFRSRIRQVVTKTGTKKEAGEGELLRILKRRYASGEITREEYREMKKDLEIGTEGKDIE